MTRRESLAELRAGSPTVHETNLRPGDVVLIVSPGWAHRCFRRTVCGVGSKWVRFDAWPVLRCAIGGDQAEGMSGDVYGTIIPVTDGNHARVEAIECWARLVADVERKGVAVTTSQLQAAMAALGLPHDPR